MATVDPSCETYGNTFGLGLVLVIALLNEFSELDAQYPPDHTGLSDVIFQATQLVLTGYLAGRRNEVNNGYFNVRL
ncbi:MAG: hypothetical protein ACKVQU_00410 [Burkholderiales bacterium]